MEKVCSHPLYTRVERENMAESFVVPSIETKRNRKEHEEKFLV